MQLTEANRTRPYLIEGTRSLPNNWAIKDNFQAFKRERDIDREQERKRDIEGEGQWGGGGLRK